MFSAVSLALTLFAATPQAHARPTVYPAWDRTHCQFLASYPAIAPQSSGPADPVNQLNTTFGNLVGAMINRFEQAGDPFMVNQVLCVGLFNDAAMGENAVAVGETHILVGWNLFQGLMRRYPDANSAAAAAVTIIAHEFGHFLQNTWHYRYPGPTVMIKELNADCVAGYLVGMQRWSAEMSTVMLMNMFDQMYQRGDMDYHDPNHHGTPAERAGAAQVGRNAGTVARWQNRDYRVITRDIMGACNATYVPLR